MFEICIDRKVIYDFQGALDDSCCENTTCMQLILIMQWLPSIHILPISNIYSLDNRPPFQRYLSLLSFWIQRIIIWLSPASRSISAWEISFIQMKPLDHFMFRPWGKAVNIWPAHTYSVCPAVGPTPIDRPTYHGGRRHCYSSSAVPSPCEAREVHRDSRRSDQDLQFNSSQGFRTCSHRAAFANCKRPGWRLAGDTR